MVTYEHQKTQIQEGLSTPCRIKLSDDANTLIEQFQKAYKANTGRIISKANVVCKLIAYGASGLKVEQERHARLAAEREASI